MGLAGSVRSPWAIAASRIATGRFQPEVASAAVEGVVLLTQHDDVTAFAGVVVDHDVFVRWGVPAHGGHATSIGQALVAVIRIKASTAPSAESPGHRPAQGVREHPALAEPLANDTPPPPLPTLTRANADDQKGRQNSHTRPTPRSVHGNERQQTAIAGSQRHLPANGVGGGT